ncbi:hypothetical protein ACTXM9_04580 [Corynebacterium variabile]|uniref:hypothetical protein n=1 Tax=Corynebacterium variabile TaxID=1727 RepID=UPI003FD12195
MSMTTSDALSTARRILSTGKALAPDRFPSSNGESGERTLAAWAELFAEYGVNYPPEVWTPAVRAWAARAAGDRMVTPRDILAAAREVIAHWETDPEKAAWLAEQRHGTLSRREAAGALPVGTAPESPADGRVTPNNALDAGADATPLGGLNAFRELRDEIGEKSIIRTVGKSTNTDGTVSPVAAALLRKKRDDLAARRAERAAKETNPVELGGGAA